MITEIVAAGILAGEFIYHRWIEPLVNPPQQPTGTLSIPTMTEGDVIPLVYGRCRVRKPVLAWCGTPIFMAAGTDYTSGALNPLPDPPDLYFCNLFFVLGMPPYLGATQLITLWVGDSAMQKGWIYPGTIHNLADLDGNGGPFISGVHTAEDNKDGMGTGGSKFAAVHALAAAGDAGAYIFGAVEFLNGNPNQVLVDAASPYTPRTEAGFAMTFYNQIIPPDVFHYNRADDPSLIPGYRHQMCAFLYQVPDIMQPSNGVLHWCIGSSSSVGSYHFEVSAQANTTPGEQNIVAELLGADSTIGDGDMNPSLVIYDLLTSPIAKLGLDPSQIDAQSFINAGHTLASETHGFSMAFEDERTAAEMINEVLAQIDAILYFDPLFGQIGIRLVRADYDPASLPVIDPTTAIALQSVALGGWTNITNKVRATFQNRLDEYRDGSSTAQNQANAVGQDGETREVTLKFPGITTQALADLVTSRELQARSRPLVKLKAVCDRSFWRTLPGDVLKVNWPEYGLSGLCCRVISVDRGTLEDGKVVIELLQDYFYIHRDRPPSHGIVKVFGGGILP